MVQHVTSYEDFKKLIATPGKAVFVDFSAKWCGPCQTIAPEFLKISAKHPNCLFLKVDINEVEKAADDFDVQSLPTFIVFKDGKKVEHLVGANLECLEKFVAKNKA